LPKIATNFHKYLARAPNYWFAILSIGKGYQM